MQATEQARIEVFDRFVLESDSEDLAETRRPLLRAFKWVMAAAGLAVLFSAESLTLLTLAAALMMAAAAVRPAYLWCAGRAPGLPIFPLFALTYVWTFAFPMLSDSPFLRQYSEATLLYAALTVTGFLLLATAVWFRIVRKPVADDRSYRTLSAGSGDVFFVICLVLLAIFLMNERGGWIDIPREYRSGVRSILFGLGTLGAFIIPYRWGTGSLPRGTWLAGAIALALCMVVYASTVFLVTALILFAMATAGYVLGRKRIPFVAIFAVVFVVSLLHLGKSEMRNAHWFGSQQRESLQPYQYPAFFAEWIGYAFQRREQAAEGAGSGKSILDRAGIMHMLLQTQAETAAGFSLVNGKSYAVIPEMLVPRIVKPDKPTSHEGTTILNVHYGNQTRAATRRTTIGWGLLAESHANFGLFGMAGLAIVLGTFYGFVTNWTRNTSPLSARFLFGILVIGVAVQGEFTAGVYVTSLFQVSIGLVLISLIFMHKESRSQVEYSMGD